MSQRIVTVYRLDQNPAPWWKAVLLQYVPTQVGEQEAVRLYYKMLFGDMYITKIERLTQKLCARCGSNLN